MATWQITNYHKKNVFERTFWTKDDVQIIREEGFRWGTWTCESDERPDIDLDNPDGYEVGFSDYDWEPVSMDDGCWAEWKFPDDMDEEERSRIEAIWDEDWYDGMENDGWSNDDTENWIYGPIELTNLDTGETWTGKEV